VGPVVSRTLLADVTELGRLNRRQAEEGGPHRVHAQASHDSQRHDADEHDVAAAVSAHAARAT
jgi:hypothetical protein